MITFAFLSHHSQDLIKKNVEIISKYGLDIFFLIIENSLNQKLKIELESKYKNLKVFIPGENLGFSKGMNKAVELCKTNFIFLNPADVIIPFECAKGIIDCIKNFDEFTLLAPTYNNEAIFKNYEENIFSSESEIKNLKIINNKYNLQQVDWIDGTFIVNKKNIKHHQIMDENFFIYFETMDMCLNFKKNNNKMYVIKNLKFDHLGQQSHDKSYNFEAQLSRCWHYNWSKFYYFKKNYSYLFALKKSIPILFKFITKCLINKIMLRNNEFKLNKAEISGLINSMMNKKSYYRPYLKK
jgi:N-acetylglucosaminyl-diphospho-decaprenol L-rhamnosyltransferase